MNGTDYNELGEHFSLLLDGKLTREQSDALAQRLTEDAALRRFYIEYIKVHTLLRTELEGTGLDRDAANTAELIGMFSGEPDSDSAEAVTQQADPSAPADTYRFRTDTARRNTARHATRSTFRIGRVAAIAAAVMVMAIVSFWAIRHMGTQRPVLAAVTASNNAFWELDGDQQQKNPMLLPAGGLQLRAGQLEITFNDGTTATLYAPTHVNLTSADHLHLSRGRVYVNAPTGATGFKVSTPGALAVDLGTEFGVSYSHDLITEVHVFKGAVNLSSSRSVSGTPDAQDQPLELKAGASGFVSWDTGPTPGRQADASLFVRSIDSLAQAEKNANTLESWREYRDRIRTDPDLVALYDFQRRDSAPRALVNISSSRGARLNGTLGDNAAATTAPRWTTGRFPGSQALLFTPSFKQFIDLPVDSALFASGDLTTVWWMQPRNTFNLDFSMVVIGCGAPRDPRGEETEAENHLYAHGLKLGKLRAFHEYGPGVNQEYLSSSPIEPDRWTHVAIVRDTAAKTYKLYINGTLSDTRPYAENPTGGDSPLSRVTIGRSGGAVLNHFDGKLDEMMIYTRALTNLEVADLYQHSRPAKQ
jgi:ferric-dicitrate binding protein FerR (iron transport regulator)